MSFMDQNSDAAKTVSESRAPVRTALNVLGLCFALSVLGRGLVESFTVFLLPISESFGWDRARVVSIYSLTALAAGAAAPPARRPFVPSYPRPPSLPGPLPRLPRFLIWAVDPPLPP